MNLAQMHDLLTMIKRVDNRHFDDATVIAWHEILAGLDDRDCAQAVVDHFRTSEAYLMPVHVYAGAQALARARQRAAREQREAIEAAEALAAGVHTGDRSADVISLVGQVRTVLPEGDPLALSWGRRYWRRRTPRAAPEPNPHYRGLPPPGGHPIAEEPA